MSLLVTAYGRYWGKAQPVPASTIAWHPLAYHSLDVAAVVEAYLVRHQRLARRLSDALGLAPERSLALLTFLAAVHDLGKFHPCFQSKVPALFAAVFPGREPLATDQHPHPQVGLGYVLEYVRERWYPELHLRDDLVPWLEPLINATCGHHGRAQGLPKVGLNGASREHAFAFADDVRELLGPLALPEAPFGEFGEFGEFGASEGAEGAAASESAEPAETKSRGGSSHTDDLRRASMEAAGLFSVCDWVGSSQVYFPYESPTHTLEEYWDLARRRADRALTELGLVERTPARLSGLAALFPAYASTATALQRHADTVPLDAKQGAQLFILEDETGAGKTEAALTLASRLIAAGLGDGLVVSLPTQTTANALFRRVLPVAGKFFDDGETPSMVLAHGQARHALGRMLESGRLEPGTISADLQSWCSESSKTALLADIGVGTIDQAVMSAVAVKHYPMRHLGLGRKVLVVDEAHACEPYLMELLATTLELHAQRGGSAIVLSATLPSAQKRRLVQAFARGRGVHCSPRLDHAHYPLATRWPGLTPASAASAAQVPHESSLCLEPSETPIEAAKAPRELRFTAIRAGGEFELIKGWLEEGQCVCLLRNTVGEAQKAYEYFSGRFGRFPGQVQLAHARFALRHRAENDQALLDRFGKTAPAEGRRGRLVIATQVAEQSLDVDFDQFVTDLAPLDALLQRAGRWRRHVRDAEGRWLPDGGVDGRPAGTFHVVMPRALGNDRFLTELTLHTSLIYDQPAVLFRTARLIESEGFLAIPGGVREAMEAVFDEAAPSPPECLAAAQLRAEEDEEEQRRRARFNCLVPSLGYSAEQGVTAPEDCVTRLGEPAIRVALCDESGEPLFGDLEESSVSVRAALLALQPGDDDRYRLALTPDATRAETWSCTAADRQGRHRDVVYARSTGLEIRAAARS